MSHSIQNTATFVPTVNTNTHSFTMTIGEGTNRKLIVALAQDTSTLHDDITFDSVSMGASVYTVVSQATTNCQVQWYLYNIPDVKAAGDYTITYTRNFATPNVVAMAWQTINSSTGGVLETLELQAGTADTTVEGIIVSEANSIVLAAASDTAVGVTFTWANEVVERFEGAGINHSTTGGDYTNTSGVEGNITVTLDDFTAGGNLVLGAITIGGLSVPSGAGVQSVISQSPLGSAFTISQQQIGSAVVGTQ